MPTVTLNLESDVLARARSAAERLRPSSAPEHGHGAVNRAAADSRDVRALIDLVDALSPQPAPLSNSHIDDELTPNEAAEILGMSRPSVMRLIAKGALHPRMVHSHHKLSRAEVVSLAHAQIRERRAAIANLVALSEELDF